MASITSVLRRLLLAKEPEDMAAWLASASGPRVTISVSSARPKRIAEPIRVTMPSSGCTRKITSR
ncbi:hypothetical protein D3C76_1265120 [compost metagenome]